MGRQPNREPRNTDEEIAQLRQEIAALQQQVTGNKELIRSNHERIDRLNQVIASYLTTDHVMDLVEVMRDDLASGGRERD